MKKYLSLALILSIASVSVVLAEYTSKGSENNAEMELQEQKPRPRCTTCGTLMSNTMVNKRDHSKKCMACKGTGKLDDGRGNKVTCGYCDGTGHPMKQVWVWKCPKCGSQQ